MCIYSGGAALAYMAVDEALDGVTGAWHDTLPPGKHQLAVHLPSAEGRDVDKQVQLLRPRRPTRPPKPCRFRISCHTKKIAMLNACGSRPILT